MNCREANEILITDFLYAHGIEPKRMSGNNYWYLSPIREEKTPSFKVDITINRWYDHGMGVGGKLVDLGIRLFEVDVNEFLSRLDSTKINDSFSFQAQPSNKVEPLIKKVKELENKALLDYLQERAVNIDVARRYCKEVYYSIGDRNYFAIGFANDIGGYEIRNKYFKGCIGPKGISTIMQPYDQNRSCKVISLFEGFIDFLTAINDDGVISESSYIVLNSVNQIHSAVAGLYSIEPARIMAYFDNDEAGANCFNTLKISYPGAINMSHEYAPFKDVNEAFVYLKSKSQSHD